MKMIPPVVRYLRLGKHLHERVFLRLTLEAVDDNRIT